MCNKLHNGRLLHRIIDITKNDKAHTLSQQGDDYTIFSVSSMSERANEFLETAVLENKFIQWYEVPLILNEVNK